MAEQTRASLWRYGSYVYALSLVGNGGFCNKKSVPAKEIMWSSRGQL